MNSNKPAPAPPPGEVEADVRAARNALRNGLYPRKCTIRGLLSALTSQAQRIAELGEERDKEARNVDALRKLCSEQRARAEAAEARVREHEAFDSAPAEYLPCANCGTPVLLSTSKHYTEEGEPCCCEECLDEHDELGCPLGEGQGEYRENPRIRKAEASLDAVIEEVENVREALNGPYPDGSIVERARDAGKTLQEIGRIVCNGDWDSYADLVSLVRTMESIAAQYAAVMKWARGRCETCGYMLMDLPDRYGAACGECEGSEYASGTNWTPAWEVEVEK